MTDGFAWDNIGIFKVPLDQEVERLQAENQALKARNAKLEENIQELKETNQELKEDYELAVEKMEILKLLRRTQKVKRVMGIKAKVQNTKKRNMKVPSPRGLHYMEMGEMITFLMEEADPEIRFPADIQNPWKYVGEYIKIICDTWGDQFFISHGDCRIGGRKTTYLVYKDPDDL